MIGVVILLAGMAIGAVVTVAIEYTWRTLALAGPRYPALPPATARQIDRAARRNRADRRRLLPARELVFRDQPARLERLSEPPSFDPFREEHTR